MGAMPGEGQCGRCLDNLGEGCEERTAFVAKSAGAYSVGLLAVLSWRLRCTN